jgi:divinyl chlorophyllide a 8-vinyl-reductase
MRVALLGATGTIGRATAVALVARGHDVLAPVRQVDATLPGAITPKIAAGTSAAAFVSAALAGESFDAVVSCIASRKGAPADAWAVDHDANIAALHAAKMAGAVRFVLLSAICVQRPLLAFQHAKLAFENELMRSGLDWSIVRPTAFFKSLSGQAERVRQGKPFLVFGDGRLTACKPISDRDTGAFLADCLTDIDKRNTVLPVGGPGPAITPLEQGELMFEAFGKKRRFRHVPLAMLDTIIGALSLAGRFSARAADAAEFARIGRYYATQSMLVLDPATGRYSADLTPEHGSDTLATHYRRLARGETQAGLGEHGVF